MFGQQSAQSVLLFALFATSNLLFAQAQTPKNLRSPIDDLAGEIPVISPQKPDVSLINDGLSKPKPKDSQEDTSTATTPDEDRDSKFQKLLTGAKLKGQFTMDGKPLSELQDETYEIRKIHKLKPDSDTWAIHARIKYGEHDLVVPVPIQVKWIGDTPVLTMDNMLVPGLGTFSARVILHGKRYAGTWQHDAVGGHLFGSIESAESESKTPAEPAEGNQPN